MAEKDTHPPADKTTPETRQARRAFGQAMSDGLRRTYDRVTTHAVPRDFMELLEKADRKHKSSA